MVKSKIISIGDELLNGQVVNTNATYISGKLSTEGISVHSIVVIGDNENDLIKELKDSEAGFDITVITGGLGPTHDDITKYVLAKYFNDKLIPRNDILDYIKTIFRKRGLEMPDINKNQALVPSKAEVIWNYHGTAPGILYEKNKRIIVAIPGVPYEMKPMVDEHLLPKFKQYFSDRFKLHHLSRNVLTTGITESALAELIGEVEKILLGNKMAFLPSFYGVRLRIDVSSTSLKKAENDMNSIIQKLISVAGDYIFGFDNELMEEIIGGYLLKLSGTLSVAESCTGGLISKRLTDISGSSRYFKGGICTYSNNAKEKLLDVSRSTLDKFGAVSRESAIEMAKGVKLKFQTDYSISVTGISGPDGGSVEKPVGTTYIGYCDNHKCYSTKFNFGDNRDRNRIRASQAALNILRNELKNVIDR